MEVQELYSKVRGQTTRSLIHFVVIVVASRTEKAAQGFHELRVYVCVFISCVQKHWRLGILIISCFFRRGSGIGQERCV